jgi:CSLREA domain-containing protein
MRNWLLRFYAVIICTGLAWPVSAQITVNSTGDAADADDTDGICETATAGECTLRAAIEEANAQSGANTIVFDISATGNNCTGDTSSDTCTISVGDTGNGTPTAGEPLTGITGQITISESGGSDQDIIVDGANVATGSSTGFPECEGSVVTEKNCPGLLLDEGSDNSEISDITVQSFSGIGVFILSSDNLVTNTTLILNGRAGTRPVGTTDTEPATSTGNTISNNYIGTLPAANCTLGPPVDVSGCVDRGNRSGVRVFKSSSNTISNNIIAYGTSSRGIQIEDWPANDNTVEGNTIFQNVGDGVDIEDDGIINNTVTQNSIFDNGGVGIDLGRDGATLNDTGGTPDDDGVVNSSGADAANKLQNFPEIVSASYDSGTNEVTITYNVPSAGGGGTNATYPITVEFFLADVDQEEGQTFIGSDTYSLTEYNNGPDKTITFTPQAATTASDYFVSTATDADGNTSEFTSQATLLPVELTSFEATVDGEDVILRWTTASETNNAGFEVQQLEAGSAAKTWSTLTFVEGHGTTELPKAYRHRATTLTPGTHTFRLRQVDFDGAFEYSPEVEVVVGLPDQYVVEPAYPNPFNPEATLRFAVQQEQRVEVGLYNLLGQRVRTLFAGTATAGQMQRVTIDGGNLSSGVYLVRVQGERFLETQRVTLVK